MFSDQHYRCGPCRNCGKPGGGFMGSTAWGHNHPCCSEACGKRLGQKLSSGMVAPSVGWEELEGYHEQALRFEIKRLRHRLKILEKRS